MCIIGIGGLVNGFRFIGKTWEGIWKVGVEDIGLVIR